MRRPVFACFLALLLVVVVATTASLAGKKDKPPVIPVYEPDADAPEAAQLEGTTWTSSGAEWRVWFKRLDDQERLNFIERVTGHPIDPLAGSPDEPPIYLTFLLVVENLGTDPLGFNPMSCWLRSTKDRVLAPLVMSDLSFNYRITGKDLPVAYENFRPAMLDGARLIEAGQRISGLLVYDMVKPKTKSWSVEVRLTLAGGDNVSMTAPYRRPPKKKGDKEQG